MVPGLQQTLLPWPIQCISNTESRRQEIFEAISGHLDMGFRALKDGERFRGRRQFAENQIAGRRAASSYKALFRFVAKGGSKLDDVTQSALLQIRDIS